MQTDLFEQHEDRSEIWKVSDLTREIKRIMESGFPTLWVSGEISNLRAHPSGHRYFVLKDNQSQLKAVLFRGGCQCPWLRTARRGGVPCLWGTDRLRTARRISTARKAHDAGWHGQHAYAI